MQLQNEQAEIADLILANDEHTNVVGPAENLSVYHYTMMASLTNTLKEIYPLISKLVGEDYFNLICKEYIYQYPSRSGNLNHYGEYFHDFLAQHETLHRFLYLPEVAQFEWACHEIYFAAEHDMFSIILLENVTPEKYPHLHLVLHPASRVMKFQFPILKIINLCEKGSNENIDLNEGGVNILVIRRELDISLVSLTEGEFTFLDMLQDHKSLEESLNTALILDPKFKLEEKLPIWIQDKTIVDCHLNEI